MTDAARARAPRFACAAALLVAALASSGAHAEERSSPALPDKPRVALLDLSTDHDEDKELALVLGSLLAERVARLAVFEVVTQDDIRRLISFERMKTALTCDDDASCLAEIGGALGARYLVTGSIGRLDQSFVVALSFIDIESVETIGRETIRAESALGLSTQLDDTLTRLMSPVLVAWRGTLVIDSDDEGASVFVDDRAVGVVPMGPIALAAGNHRVSLSKDGYVSSLEEVHVPPRGRVSLAVRLVPLSETYDALFQTAALTLGGGVALALVGGALALGGGVGGLVWSESVKMQGKPTSSAPLSPVLVSEADALEIGVARAVAASAAVVGAALVTAGIVLVVVADFPDEPPPGREDPASSGVAVEGRP